MRIYSLIAVVMGLFIGCSKDNGSVSTETLKAKFSLYSLNGSSNQAPYYNSFGVAYSKSISSPIDVKIRLSGESFDTTFTINIEANYTSEPVSFGWIDKEQGIPLVGISKKYLVLTSSKVFEGEILSIKADDPKYKFEILTKN